MPLQRLQRFSNGRELSPESRFHNPKQAFERLKQKVSGLLREELESRKRELTLPNACLAVAFVGVNISQADLNNLSDQDKTELARAITEQILRAGFQGFTHEMAIRELGLVPDVRKKSPGSAPVKVCVVPTSITGRPNIGEIRITRDEIKTNSIQLQTLQTYADTRLPAKCLQDDSEYDYTYKAITPPDRLLRLSDLSGYQEITFYIDVEPLQVGESVELKSNFDNSRALQRLALGIWGDEHKYTVTGNKIDIKKKRLAELGEVDNCPILKFSGQNSSREIDLREILEVTVQRV